MKIKKKIIQVVKEEIETMPAKYKVIVLLWYYEQISIVESKRQIRST